MQGLKKCGKTKEMMKNIHTACKESHHEKNLTRNNWQTDPILIICINTHKSHVWQDTYSCGVVPSEFEHTKVYTPSQIDISTLGKINTQKEGQAHT